jgi:hypothetical protein
MDEDPCLSCSQVKKDTDVDKKDRQLAKLELEVATLELSQIAQYLYLLIEKLSRISVEITSKFGET